MTAILYIPIVLSLATRGAYFLHFGNERAEQVSKLPGKVGLRD
jgi:hypothetical protein